MLLPESNAQLAAIRTISGLLRHTKVGDRRGQDRSKTCGISTEERRRKGRRVRASEECTRKPTVLFEFALW